MQNPLNDQNGVTSEMRVVLRWLGVVGQRFEMISGIFGKRVTDGYMTGQNLS